MNGRTILLILLNGAYAFLVIALASCLGSGSSHPPAIEEPGDTTITPDPAATPTPPAPYEPGPTSGEIVVWGDSTTSGVGASSADLSYPAQLQALTGRSTFNGGVSGQTSDQIAAREGGSPALLTFPANALPSAGPVVVQSQSTLPISKEGPGPISGTIHGFHGTLDRNDNFQLIFTRDAAGVVEYIPPQSPFFPDTYGREAQINVFWMGQNNFYDAQAVKSDITKSIAFLSTQKFIVMSLLNSGTESIGTPPYAELALINADLAQTYPGHFLDIRKVLINKYDPTQPGDVQDYNNDVPPRSLRNDNEHLNDEGYRIVAQEIAALVAAKRW